MIIGRTALAAGLLAATLASVAIAAMWRIQALPEAHVDLARVEVATRVAAAVRWHGEADADGGDGPHACAQMKATAERWQSALTALRKRLGLSRPITVDADALHGPSDRVDCGVRARRLRAKLHDALALFAATDRWLDGRDGRAAPGKAERGSVARIEPADARTWNPYAMLPLELISDDGTRLATHRDLAGERWLPAQRSISEIAQDPLLAAGIAEVVSLARFRPVRLAMLTGREVPAGARLVLTLDADLQRASASWLRCFTGSLADCQPGNGLPPSLLADPRLATAAAAPRAPAAALVVVDVATGRIVAMAGAVGACARAALQRDAETSPDGHTAFVRAGDRCAQFPDRRHGYLLGEHAAFWVVPPGSFAKVPVAAACLAARHFTPQARAELRAQLAKSEDNEAFRRLGLACAPAFQRAWSGIAEARSIAAAGVPWKAVRATPGTFDSANLLDPADYEAAARRLRASPRAEREMGPELTARYLRSAAVASLAIGGGGMGMNTLSIAGAMRDLALRADGDSTASEMHLIRDADDAVDDRSLLHFDAPSAKATLAALGAVTSSAEGGTAHGACTRVLGQCPAMGLPDLAGKTGTADFTVSDHSLRVKDGTTRMPAKVFGAVFEAAGRRYAAAAMVLRGRDLDGRLELHGNAAAELVLLARQRLRDRVTVGRPESEQAGQRSHHDRGP
jgi:hypothetical protein